VSEENRSHTLLHGHTRPPLPPRRVWVVVGSMMLVLVGIFLCCRFV
jgi:hypothetical protein